MTNTLLFSILGGEMSFHEEVEYIPESNRKAYMQRLLNKHQANSEVKLRCECSYLDNISGTWPVLNELRANGDYLTF